jgi:signal transduction histidine kinase
VFLSVSHELRTPLTSIKGYAEGIEDGTIAPGEAAPVIEREAGRLERLVADLLALARLRQGVLDVRSEPVDLGEAAREAVERLQPQARAADVDVRIDGAAAPVTADHDRVVQVLSNLIENAIRLTPAGGAVTVSLAEGSASVRDEGPGIPEEDLPQAFDRFHLRRRHGGSPDGAGTGLAIVRELTEAMGGSVGVRNPSGGGAEFNLRFPT